MNAALTRLAASRSRLDSTQPVAIRRETSSACVGPESAMIGRPVPAYSVMISVMRAFVQRSMPFVAETRIASAGRCGAMACAVSRSAKLGTA